jgi:hypothetical protein
VSGHGTPCLVMGVERRIHLHTESDSKAGRPRGLYGNNFQIASEGQVKSAVQRLDPPTISNILAMAAPGYGRGTYTRAQIVDIFTTAYTSFTATRLESKRAADVAAGTPTAAAAGGESKNAANVKVMVHTGNWGTG